MLKDLREENNYYEIQQFRQIWVWLILLLVEFALLFTILSGMINLLVSIIIISIGFGFIWLLYRMKLITIINEDGINIIFAPFTNFIIPFNKIKKYQIRQYRPIIEYGGCVIEPEAPDYHCKDCRYEWKRGNRLDGHYAEE